MPRSQTALLAAMAAASLAVVAVAVADDTPAPHGATAFATQQKQLDALLGTVDLTRAPAGVDAETWKASIPEDNALDAARVALGRELYFDTALSASGTVACATCHDVARSFTDRRPVSEGIGGALGRRNAPTTMNAALLHTQFLDGRSATLEVQAGQPILNSIEMGMPDRETAVAALVKKGYGPKFEAAFGRELNYGDLERALAAFERTLIFLDAPFDRFMAGETDAISPEAQAGWVLFNGKGRCVSCHPMTDANPLGTDNRFHNIGVSARTKDFETLARRAIVALQEDPSEEKLDELAIGTDFSELGRFMVTRNYADIGAFRTSQLRNIGITGPYMHDGSMQTLWDTIDHYNKGGEDNAFLDGGIEALALSDQEVDQLVAFMFTLTDRRFADLNSAEIERQRGIAATKRPFRDEALANRRVLGFETRVMGKDSTLGKQ